MVSSNWLAAGLGGGCASDYVDEAVDATLAELSTRFHFRRVVSPGEANPIAFQIAPGALALDVPQSSKIMYGFTLMGKVVELSEPRQTPEAFNLSASVAAGGVELCAGLAQVRHDLFRLAVTTSSLTTVLLNSSPTNTRIFSGVVQVEPLTTTAAGTKIV